MRIVLNKNVEKKVINRRNRYEYIIFLLPFIGFAFTILFGLFSSRIRLVLNHLVVYMICVFGGGTLMYIMLQTGAENYALGLLFFLLLLIILWVLVPMLIAYSLIFYLDDLYILSKFDDGYNSDQININTIKKSEDFLFRKLFMR